MKLLTKENEKKLPALYAQDGKGKESIAYVKFFKPDSNWTWYATEYDPVEKVFFGLVQSLDQELGYFTLEQLQSARGSLGLPIERDIYFDPCPLKDVMI